MATEGWTNAAAAVITGAVGVVATLLSSGVGMSGSWPLLVMFVAGTATGLLAFHGLFAARKKRWLASGVGPPRVWIESATMRVRTSANGELISAHKINMYIGVVGTVDPDGFSVELLPAMGAALSLDKGNAAFSLVESAADHLVIEIRPDRPHEAQFQEIAEMARARKVVKVLLKSKDTSPSRSDGLIFMVEP
jgi:hypothetical protein